MKTENSIDIDAPVEQAFAYLVDPTHLPEYGPGVGEVKDIQRLPDGRSTYTVVAKVLGLHVESKVEQVEVVPNERIVEKSHGAGLEDITTTQFEVLESGKTRVTMDGETTLHGVGPLAKYGEPFFTKYFDHATKMCMEAIRAHIEANVPSGATL